MQQDWERSIIKCIESLGEEADRQDIYNKIGNFVLLTGEHLKIRYGRPNYYHQIRKHLSNMIKKGYVIKTSENCYRLTEKGLGHRKIEL